MVTHQQAAVEPVTVLVHNPPALFVAGVIAVAAGLALILGHTVWSGGVLPVFVTLVSWVALTKGVLILIPSPEAASEFFFVRRHYEELYYWYTAASPPLGIYLIPGTSRAHAR